MAMTTEQFVHEIETMSVLDLNTLVKAIEEKFGVSAAAAAPMMVAGAPPSAAAAPVEEQTEFTVVLSEVGEKKINVIKAVREVTSLGLKEAKDLVEGRGAPGSKRPSRSSATINCAFPTCTAGGRSKISSRTSDSGSSTPPGGSARCCAA